MQLSPCPELCLCLWQKGSYPRSEHCLEPARGIGFQFQQRLSFPFFSYPSSHHRIIPIPISLPPSPFLSLPLWNPPACPRDGAGGGGGRRENSSRYYTKASCIPSVNPRGRLSNLIKAKGLLFYLLSFLIFSSLRQERKERGREMLALRGGAAMQDFPSLLSLLLRKDHGPVTRSARGSPALDGSSPTAVI